MRSLNNDNTTSLVRLQAVGDFQTQGLHNLNGDVINLSSFTCLKSIGEDRKKKKTIQKPSSNVKLGNEEFEF